jgi:hypothetical protein
MTDKKEEHFFSLNPADDESPNIYLNDFIEEEIEETKIPPVLFRQRQQKEEKREEIAKISIEKPIKKENILKEKPAIIDAIKEEDKKTEKVGGSKIRVILSAFLIISGLIYLIFYMNSTITLNISGSDFTPLATFAENITYAAADNQSFAIDIDYSKFNQEGRKASVGIAGSVIGNGIVKVFLANEKGEKYFLYDSEIENSEKFFKITKVTGSTTENQANADDRKFEYSCIDTCSPKINEGRYILEIEVDGNAMISIDKMIFGF